jgi:hypothetical protein
MDQNQVRTQNISLGRRGVADPEVIYNLFDFKNYVKNHVVSTT